MADLTETPTRSDVIIARLLRDLLEQAQYVCEKAILENTDIEELRKRGKRYHAALVDCGSAHVTLSAERMGQKVS